MYYSDGSVRDFGTTNVVNSEDWNFGSPRRRPPYRDVTPGTVHRYVADDSSVSRSYPNARAVGSVTWVWGTDHYVTSSGKPDAVSAYLGAIAKANGGFDLAEDLATGGQTVDMISKRIRTLAEAAKQLKRGNPFAFAKTLNLSSMSRRSAAAIKNSPNALANHWLEYTYGWKPLVQDVYDGLQMYRDGIAKEGHIVRGSKGHGRVRPSPGLTGGKISERGAGYRGSYLATVGNPTAFTLNQLGLLNPASLAWNLLPYSFVVDWFLPVGDVFTALTSGIGVRNQIGCITYETVTKFYSKGPGILYQDNRAVQRDGITPIGAALQLPTLLAANLGWQRLTSGAALLKQRFSR